MRTTIQINDSLLEKAKSEALKRHCTLGKIVEDALRTALSAPKAVAQRPKTKLPTFKGRGLQPGVDLDSSASLLDIMENR